MTNPQTLRIRELNDRFRTTGMGGRILLSQGVSSLPPLLVLNVARQVVTFSDFTPDNDPHGEHDFGAFTMEERKFFWKIDYYATDRYASELSRLPPMLSDMAGTVLTDVNKDSAEWNDLRSSKWGADGASAEK